MTDGLDVYSLIKKGGIFYDVEGSTPGEIYANVFQKISLPPEADRDLVLSELVSREEILSTAVGNGFAIPHPRRPLMPSKASQKIAVIFPKNPIDMNAPDKKRVNAMFMLLTSSPQDHIKILGRLAELFREDKFRSIVDRKPSEKDLMWCIEQLGF